MPPCSATIFFRKDLFSEFRPNETNRVLTALISASPGVVSKSHSFQIAAKIQQREVANGQLKLSYQHAMEEEQTEYVERLKSLQDQVGATCTISTHTCPYRYKRAFFVRLNSPPNQVSSSSSLDNNLDERANHGPHALFVAASQNVHAAAELLAFPLGSSLAGPFCCHAFSVHHQVNKMSHFTDLSKVEQVSSMVRRMEKDIEECSDQAILFNSREQ